MRPSKRVTETLVVHEPLVPVLLGEKGKTIRNIEEVRDGNRNRVLGDQAWNQHATEADFEDALHS